MDVLTLDLIDEIEEEEQEPSSYTYRLDLENKRIIGKVDGQTAIEQAIRKILITQRFHCLIYNDQYGSEIKSTVIMNDVTPEYLKSELPRLVEDALLADSRILGVTNFSYALEDDKAYISATIDTIHGEISVEEVI